MSSGADFCIFQIFDFKTNAMENTIIHSKVLISDFRRQANNSESSGSEIQFQTVVELDTDDHLVDEDEVNLMQSLGLPTQFATTKRYYRSKDPSFVTDNSLDIETINQRFLDYWHEKGDTLVLNSWISKYKDHIDPKFLENCDGSVRKQENSVVDTETESDWSEKWSEHYCSVYESQYHLFVNGAVDSSLSSRVKSVSISDGSEDVDDSDATYSSKKDINTSFVNDVHRSNAKQRSETRRNRSSNNGDDEPPDERPIKIKRECESDSILSDEEIKPLKEVELKYKKSLDSIEPIESSEDVNKGEWKTQKRKKKHKPKNSWHWQKRYRLFSRFDEGIKLDDESWYSVTPEKIAAHIAKRVINDQVHLIVDGFCGAGGNTIQFALAAPHVRVIAADIDENKIALAKHNAEIYGVDQRIDFIVADFLRVPDLLKVKVDAVFVSPPWGGPDYKKSEKYRLDMMTPDVNDILNACRALTPNIAFYLPRNIDESDLLRVAQSTFEIEQNILNHKLLTVTAYFGNLINCQPST